MHSVFGDATGGTISSFAAKDEIIIVGDETGSGSGQVTVWSPPSCGDLICDTNRESCSSCLADCGNCLTAFVTGPSDEAFGTAICLRTASEVVVCYYHINIYLHIYLFLSV